jgi:hypothetical protein
MRSQSPLTDKAKARESGRKRLNEDSARLAVAWVLGEVTAVQVRSVIPDEGNLYSFLARGMRDAVAMGIVEVITK